MRRIPSSALVLQERRRKAQKRRRKCFVISISRPKEYSVFMGCNGSVCKHTCEAAKAADGAAPASELAAVSISAFPAFEAAAEEEAVALANGEWLMDIMMQG
jgi:hypothetical protein